ncbi:MAG: hypothetical protein NTV34_17725 [Proteobacteria bacterium]|nr:hypothetical protein [Pseudomonadota bacterium]
MTTLIRILAFVLACTVAPACVQIRAADDSKPLQASSNSTTVVQFLAEAADAVSTQNIDRARRAYDQATNVCDNTSLALAVATNADAIANGNGGGCIGR